MLKKESTGLPIVCIAALVVLSLLSLPAQAIWHSILQEHFDYTPQVWSQISSPNSSINPPRWLDDPWHQWGQQGPPRGWGIQDWMAIESQGQYHRAIWCVGLPGDLAPEFDPYPTNVNSWAKYGAFSLLNAQAARISFWYRYETENDQDYLAWEVQDGSGSYELARKFGPSYQWYIANISMDSIPNGMGGYHSMLGQSSVYLKFHFVSNGQQLSPCMGGFIDELSIAWDDGVLDLVAETPSLADTDSVLVNTPQVGDSIRFRLNWIIYGGAGVTRAFNIRCQVDGQTFYTERRNVDFGGETFIPCVTFSNCWLVQDTLSHTVSWLLDSDNEIAELSETNNDTFKVFQGILPDVPPSLVILNPVPGDTANLQYTVNYDAHDPDNVATMTFYWTTDTISGFGNPIQNAVNIQEHDTTGSFVWTTSNISPGPKWIMGVITDGLETRTAYSPGPVVISHTWGLPTIEVTSPATIDTVATAYEITWNDTDPLGNGTLSLYWDMDSYGFNGVPIPGAQNIPTSDTTNSFLWDLSAMNNMRVWVYAKIQNANGISQDYAPGSLVIQHSGVTDPWLAGDLPQAFALENVYPNPFNSSTTIQVALPRAERVAIQVYDALGRLAATPFQGILEPGRHDIPWTPADLPSGMYLVRFSAPGVEQQSRAVYLK